MRELLLELRSAGTTIFLNSHLLSELEMICDRVAILVDGHVARQGTLTELTEHTVEYRIRFQGDLAPVQKKIETLGATIDGIGTLRVPVVAEGPPPAGTGARLPPVRTYRD